MVCDAIKNYLEESSNSKLVLFTKKMNHRKNSFYSIQATYKY